MSQPGQEPEDRPVNPVFVLANGTRVPFDLRYTGFQGQWRTWLPVIEGDVAKLLPMVHAVDAEYWPTGAALSLPSLESRQASHEWGKRVISNSPIFKRVFTGGREIRRNE
jgi:hypothetical protein